jgi:hypothetical protein
LIAAHPDIYAVQDDVHFGILESNVFNDFSRMFPNLDTSEARIAFTAIWEKSDFVRLAEVDLGELMSAHKPKNVFDAFKFLMSDAVRIHGAKCWLQKCSPVQLADHGKHFHEASRIVITRNFNAVLVSAIENAKSNHNQSNQLRLVSNYALQNRILQIIAKERGVYVVDYDSLKASPSDTVNKIFDFLKLSRHDISDEAPFQPNTSFAHQQSRPELRLSTKFFSLFLRGVFALMPSPIPLWLWKQLRGNTKPSILRGTFRKMSDHE